MRVDPTRPDLTHHFMGLVRVDTIFVPGLKNPTHAHIFPSGLDREMGPGQILPGHRDTFENSLLKNIMIPRYIMNQTNT
jgi:hypothetical protein